MLTCKSLFERVTEICRQCGGLRRAARHLGMSAGFLSQVRSGKKRPSVSTLKKLGLRQIISYEEIYEEKT